MKPLIALCTILATTTLAAATSEPKPIANEFYFHGMLVVDGIPLNGLYNLQFQVHDDPLVESSITPALGMSNVPVADGRFVVHLEFPDTELFSYEYTGCYPYMQFGVMGMPNSHSRIPLTASNFSLRHPGFRVQVVDDSANVKGGHRDNVIAQAAVGTSILGGGRLSAPNIVVSSYASILGGVGNEVLADYAVVSGGRLNAIIGARSFIGSGRDNFIEGEESAVVSGSDNLAKGESSFVGAGKENHAEGKEAFVGSGKLNTAKGHKSVVGGGKLNEADGLKSTVPGGYKNKAKGRYSFAAGKLATANHKGAFVWGDSSDYEFTSTGDDQFLIRANGGVGIGTNSPFSQLTVGTSNHNYGITHTDGVRTLTTFLGGSSNSAWIGTQSNHSLAFFTNDSTAHMLIDTAGNVGIGTTTPGPFRLAVNGNAAKPGGGFWASFSDQRLKRDIQPLAPGMLDRLLSINGYTFTYDDAAITSRLALPGTQIGLIAQEVANVFPDWVEADEEGYLFVTERGLTAIVVEAMRELRAEKDAEIDALRDELNQLRTLLEQLLDATATR